MGMVIDFPEAGRVARVSRTMADRVESATVIILPVIRIERYTDEPSGLEPGESPGHRRRRRRRTSRS